MADHVIQIRSHGASGFEVCVVPPHPDYPPATYDSHKQAIGAAGGLRLVTGWRKVDQTEGGGYG